MKRYMKKGAAIVIALWIACFLVACSTGHLPEEPDRFSGRSKESIHLSLGESHEEKLEGNDAKNGSLIYTFSNARMVTKEPVEGSAADTMLLFKEDGSSLAYRDVVQDDGSFIDGVYMLLFDVTVQSRDAEMHTIFEVDDEEIPLGQWPDPYIFSAGGIELVDTSSATTDREDKKGEFPYYATEQTMNYFSQKDELINSKEIEEIAALSEDPKLATEVIQKMRLENHGWSSFRIEPGEEITYTIGYVVGDRNAGFMWNLDSLALAFYGNSLNYNVFIDLDLDGSAVR